MLEIFSPFQEDKLFNGDRVFEREKGDRILEAKTLTDVFNSLGFVLIMHKRLAFLGFDATILEPNNALSMTSNIGFVGDNDNSDAALI